jgi:hypothetical protein
VAAHPFRAPHFHAGLDSVEADLQGHTLTLTVLSRPSIFEQVLGADLRFAQFEERDA